MIKTNSQTLNLLNLLKQIEIQIRTLESKLRENNKELNSFKEIVGLQNKKIEDQFDQIKFLKTEIDQLREKHVKF